MKTRTVPLEGAREAVAELRRDRLVAVPTETVYGLAARAESQPAVEEIFRVKGRPGDNPLIVHCSDAEQAFSLADGAPGWAHALARRFWPGPLTLVFRSAVDWPWVQAGHTTLAVRVPAPGYLRSLIREAGPLAAPSANRSGGPSPTTAAHVLADLDGQIPLIVDGGPCEQGLESTVVDCTGPAPVILRPGPVTEAMIGEALSGETAGDEDGDDSGPTGLGVSPGTRHPHYRPRARVRLVESVEGLDVPSNAMVIAPAWGAGEEAATGTADRAWSAVRHWTTVEEIARNLYAWLREADDLGADEVVVVPPPEKGLGVAVMNRLRKAAAD